MYNKLPSCIVPLPVHIFRGCVLPEGLVMKPVGFKPSSRRRLFVMRPPFLRIRHAINTRYRSLQTPPYSVQGSGYTRNSEGRRRGIRVVVRWNGVECILRTDARSSDLLD